MNDENSTVSDSFEKPFPAYEGNEKIIFASYAHKDREIVFL